MRVRFSAHGPLAALVLSLAAWGGCGGDAPGDPPGLAAQPGLGRPALPEVAGLRERRASFTEAGLIRSGDQFESALPSQRVAGAGGKASFSPAGAANAGKSSLAYAIYAFDVADYDRDLNLRLSWSTAPAAGTAFVALADFTAGHWHWFGVGPANVLDFADLQRYASPAPQSTLYAAVLVTQGAATLERVRIGTQPAPGAPNAALQADVPTGKAPLAVDFDASASAAAAPAALARFEFDFGEGSGFVDQGLVATAAHAYQVVGTYNAVVRITDSLGAQDTASVTITVTPASLIYDEVEHNDTADAANSLLLPLDNYRASLGTDGGPGYLGYDGDINDFFSFSNAVVGDELGFSIQFDGATADIDVELLDSEGDFLDGSFGAADAERFSYRLAAGDVAPYILHCYSTGGYSDYTISVAAGLPTAALSAAPLIGAVPLDVVFNAGGSADPAPGSIVNYELDPQDDGTYDFAQATPVFNFRYTAGGLYTARVRVTDNAGNQDTATITVGPGLSYGEAENNDLPEAATPLPALPFTGFTGNLGPGGIYDGDEDDYLRLPVLPAGSVLGLRMTHDTLQNHSLELYDANDTYITGSYNAGSPEAFSHTVDAADAQPYYLHVYSVLGAADYALSATLDAPTARLAAMPPAGPSPLPVLLDASGSDDIAPGAIAAYEFDPEGDGTFEAPQAGPTFAAQYAAGGIYRATVRITDNDGNQAVGTVLVLVDLAYDEVEQNDSYTAPGVFPDLPFAGFTGSQGSGPGYVGYDGDQSDFFTFNVAPGQTVTFSLSYDDASGQMSLDLYDRLGDNASYVAGQGFADGSAGTATITYAIGSAAEDDGGPYTLRIWDADQTHYGDYAVSGGVS